MTDIFDRATELEEIARDEALARQQQRSRNAINPALESAEDCVACGEIIPEPRRAALPGVQHCIACAQQKESLLQRQRQ